MFESSPPHTSASSRLKFVLWILNIKSGRWQDDLPQSFRGITCSAQERTCILEEPAFIPRDVDAAGISERAGHTNSPSQLTWNAGTSAPSALTLPGHQATAVSMELGSNTQKGLPGAHGAPRAWGRGHLPGHAQMAVNVFKIWGKKEIY